MTDCPGTSPLILVADDDATHRLLIEEALSEAGYRVTEAADGLDALEKAREQRPDLMILDMLMPYLDGFAVLEQARQDRLLHNLPILVVTGLDDTSSIERALNLGATDFMTKPITWAFLEYRVKYLLRNSQLERQLGETQERLNLAFEASRDGLWDWDVPSGTLHRNARWETMLGYAPGETKPHIDTWENLVHPEDRSAVLDALNRHLEGKSADYGAEIRMRSKSGDWVWILTRGKVVCRDRDGRPLRAAGTHADITELKRTEEKLRIAKSQAEAASQAKSEFLANMSHELRTPLNAIIGFSDGLEREIFGSLGDKTKEYLRDIKNSGTHLLRIINEILDIAKAESGKLELCEIEFDIAVVVADVVRMLRDQAQQAGIALNSRTAEEMPPFYGDEVRIRQILINLLSNAIKFTPSDGRVGVDAHIDEDANMVLRVTDTGIGMKPEDVPKALAPFSQVDGKLAREYEGTGLGLPLAVKMAELHGGSLTVESQPGVGTTVRVVLPRERLSQSNRPAA